LGTYAREKCGFNFWVAEMPSAAATVLLSRFLTSLGEILPCAAFNPYPAKVSEFIGKVRQIVSRIKLHSKLKYLSPYDARLICNAVLDINEVHIIRKEIGVAHLDTRTRFGDFADRAIGCIGPVPENELAGKERPLTPCSTLI
jgi:hypothetical protein